MAVYNKGINAGTSTNAGTSIFTLTSTEEEKKKALRIVLTDIATNAALLDVNLERDKVVDAIPLEVVADATPERVIELDVEIPIGKTLEGILKPQVADSQAVIDGWVEYLIL